MRSWDSSVNLPYRLSRSQWKHTNSSQLVWDRPRESDRFLFAALLLYHTWRQAYECPDILGRHPSTVFAPPQGILCMWLLSRTWGWQCFKRQEGFKQWARGANVWRYLCWVVACSQLPKRKLDGKVQCLMTDDARHCSRVLWSKYSKTLYVCIRVPSSDDSMTLALRSQQRQRLASALEYVTNVLEGILCQCSMQIWSVNTRIAEILLMAS